MTRTFLLAAVVSAAPASVVREQLGLELEPAKAPVEVFVVDRAELPTED